jgi:DNA-binding XRE family transcriptional regulator
MAKIGNQGDGGGRPPVVFDEKQTAQVEALAAVMTKVQMADYFGISEPTLKQIEERQPEVSLAYKRGKAKAIGSVGSNLLSQAKNGNVTAIIFYLKTQAGWREEREPERELPPIQIHVNTPNDSAE